MGWITLTLAIGFTGVCYFLERIADALELRNRRERRQSRSEAE